MNTTELLPLSEETKNMSNKTKLFSPLFSSRNLKQQPLRGPKFGKRHLQVINLCFLVFVAYYTRNNLSVAIIAMTDRNASLVNEVQTFNWTNKNVILSSFFMGYVPSQVTVSWIIPRVNVKTLAISSMGISSILGLLTPTLATYFGDKGAIVARALQGVSHGFVFPLVQHLLALWVPPRERGILGGSVFAAKPIATVLGMIVPGYLAASSFGWPSIFYSSNIIALFWCVSFGIFSHEKPKLHPFISNKERRYIENSIGQPVVKKAIPTPFKEIIKSTPFWALTTAAFGYVWGFWTLQTQLPMYLKYVMKFKIKSSGLVSAFPYLMQFLASYVFSFFSDYFLQKNVWSIEAARKTMNSIGCFVPAVALVLLSNIGEGNSTITICLLTIAIASTGACFCGYTINHMDLSPNHSSVLVGISNGLAQSCGFLAPLFVQAVVKNEEDPNEWKIVFYTSAGLYVLAGLVFIFFGSGKLQTWDNLSKPGKQNKEDQSIELKILN